MNSKSHTLFCLAALIILCFAPVVASLAIPPITPIRRSQFGFRALLRLTGPDAVNWQIAGEPNFASLPRVMRQR